MTWRRLGLLLLLAVCSLLVAWWAGCMPVRPRDAFAQPAGWVWTVEPGATTPIHGGRYSLDSLARGSRGHPGLPIWRVRFLEPADKLHPALRPMLAASPGDTQGVELVIGLRDRVRVPRLPIERVSVNRDSASQARGTIAVDSVWTVLRGARRAEYARQESLLTSRYGVTVRREFDLTQAVVARVPRGRVREIAGLSQVTSLRPVLMRGRPPQVDHAAVGWVAAELGFGPYETAQLLNGRIRLLDTGVNAGHPWLYGVPAVDPPPQDSPALVLHDCMEGTNCGGSVTGDITSGGHGTSSAALLVTGSGAPDGSQGVTRARVHSCRVWRIDAKGYTAYDANAIELALHGDFAPLPSVAAVQVCDGEGPDGAIASSADGAFDAGIAVVAAIGNSNAWNPQYDGTGARSPGDARGVLGIGARECATGATTVDEGYGGVADRCKPDLQLYTGTKTATAGGSWGTFPGTSGATPYAAAAALALRGLYEAAAGIVDPGQVYAGLIACGDEARPPGGDFPADRGAGLVKLPLGGRAWFSSEDLRNGARREIPIQVPGDTRRLRVALWWRDPSPLRLPLNLEVVRHCDFDLELHGPGNDAPAVSSGAPGVFERVDVALTPTGPASATRTWRVRILANKVGSEPVTVYWAAFATP